jgi:uncharacterized protein YfcZ (UPF0381/DUF406 family)
MSSSDAEINMGTGFTSNPENVKKAGLAALVAVVLIGIYMLNSTLSSNLADYKKRADELESSIIHLTVRNDLLIENINKHFAQVRNLQDAFFEEKKATTKENFSLFGISVIYTSRLTELEAKAKLVNEDLVKEVEQQKKTRAELDGKLADLEKLVATLNAENATLLSKAPVVDDAALLRGMDARFKDNLEAMLKATSAYYMKDVPASQINNYKRVSALLTDIMLSKKQFADGLLEQLQKDLVRFIKPGSNDCANINQIKSEARQMREQLRPVVNMLLRNSVPEESNNALQALAAEIFMIGQSIVFDLLTVNCATEDEATRTDYVVKRINLFRTVVNRLLGSFAMNAHGALSASYNAF